MNRPQQFLQKIQSLPEDAKKILAGASIVVAAFLVFSAWNMLVSQRLVALSDNKSAEEILADKLEAFQKKEPALSPVAGITESFKSLKNLVPRTAPSETEPRMPKKKIDFYHSIRNSVAAIQGAWENVTEAAQKKAVELFINN